MSSPAKRRKTKHETEPARPARNLDFFFSKQRASASREPDSTPASSPLPGPDAGNDEEQLTDEQLARKLQEEWSREDALNAQAESSFASTAPIASQEVPHTNGLYSEPEPPATRKKEIRPNSEATHQDALIPANTNGEAARTKTLSLQSAVAQEDTVTTEIPFDQSPLTFDPDEYLPRLRRQWELEGGSATYALLTRCFVLVNTTQSRIKIVDNLVNLLRILIEGDPSSLLSAVWLATNAISPPYIDLELGLGGSAISKALKKVCGLDSSSLKTLYDKHGDAGDVAFEAKKRQSLTLLKPKPLSIKGVYDALVKIANNRGQGSVETKQRIVERLVQDARGAEESRYIVRTLVQHLRIGAVKTTMLIALSRAFLLSRPRDAEFAIRDRKQLATLKKEELAEVWSRSEEIVKACFARRPNYNDLVPALLDIGVCDELLVRCGLGLHIPLRPMLGNITRDLGDMLTKLQGRDFSCEFKYDGQRAQVHCDGSGKVTIFSRHLEVMTEKYPDLVELVPKIRGESVRSFIMEGEVVAVDRGSGDLKTFQTLANRARKDVAVQSVKVDVCLFAFDLMYLNGEELLSRSFRERRNLLRSLFTEIPHHFTWVKSIDATSEDSETVTEFFKSATDIKCEGIMVKVLDNLPNPDLLADLGLEPDKPPEAATPAPTPSKRKKPAKKKGKDDTTSDAADDKDKDKPSAGSRRKALLSTYEPDKRSDSWLKVKKDYDTASFETLDLIPVGAWHGQGRKHNWWSPILLAVRNPETGALEAVTKCISGFTDKFYQANKEKYDEDGPNTISRPGYVEYVGEPDVWFEPQEVWEMQFADITISPTYTAALGLVHEEKGLSTRFPRFLKVREDKGIDEATTSDYLATLWRRQEAKAPVRTAGEAGVGKEDGDDDGELYD